MIRTRLITYPAMSPPWTFAASCHLSGLGGGARAPPPISRRDPYWVAYMIGYGKDPYADQLNTGPTLVPARR